MQIRLTPCIKILLILNLVIFVIQQTLDQYTQIPFTHYFGLVPDLFLSNFWIWQVYTYSFLHGDTMHLALNMFMLFFIGLEIEQIWGWKRFFTYYTACCLAAGVLYLIFQAFVPGASAIPLVGASGGIYGLLIAFGILFGERTMLFMMLFPMKAKHFIWILAGIEFMSTVFSGTRSFLSGIAHMGGMLAGFLYLVVFAYWRMRQREKAALGPSKKSRSASHLKLVVTKPDDRSGGGGSGGNDESDSNDPKTWH